MTAIPDDDQCVRFVPSKCEGMPDVTEVAVFPDRIEVMSAGQLKTFRFRDIARRQGPLLHDLLRRLRGKPAARRVPGGRSYGCLVFYTKPELRVSMPEGDSDRDFMDTIRWKICEVVDKGGYFIWDLT